MTATAPLAAPSTSDLRVRELAPLPTPAEMLADLPLTGANADLVARSRDEVRAVLSGIDDRLLVVVGPCSVHDADAAGRQHLQPDLEQGPGRIGQRRNDSAGAQRGEREVRETGRFCGGHGGRRGRGRAPALRGGCDQ